MNIKDKIINLDTRDYHMHSLNFSDWFNSVDEIVKFAWDIWLTEIAITDHSQYAIDIHSRKSPSWRWLATRWKNVFNNINVIFWVEWDIINDYWDVSFDIQWKEWNFIILSLHKKPYKWSLENVNLAYENAIKRHHKKIKFIWHPCLKETSEFLDIGKLVILANKYNIPLEINGAGLMLWKIDLEKQKNMLELWDRFYINSDAHNLYELKEARNFAINYLKENWYI